MIFFSALFYSYSEKYFVFLLFFTLTQDYFVAKKIEESEDNKHRKFYLIYSLTSNLSILFLLKYFNFFSNSANELNKMFGGKSNPFHLTILLPAGISFYTFQSMSYVVDVYRQEIPASKNWLNYAFYLSFFPQLVAGPIVTAKEFYPEIEKFLTVKFAEIPLKKAMYFILLGFIKKSVIADNISVIVDFCFKEENIPVISSASLLIGMFSYSIQIYCDFSGYTDLAIGIALLFGINLPENFRFPYLATSVTDFWRRWHITLSLWLKNYLYIPIGGNRNGELSTHRNLIVTMLLGGLWHGASWNFLIWGGLHGILLSIERIFSSGKKSDVRQFWKYSKIIFVFTVVSIVWIFFRAKNLNSSLEYISGIISMRSGFEISNSLKNQFAMIMILLIFSNIIGQKFEVRIVEWLNKESGFGYYVFFSTLVIGSILLSGDLKTFIYFVF